MGQNGNSVIDLLVPSTDDQNEGESGSSEQETTNENASEQALEQAAEQQAQSADDQSQSNESQQQASGDSQEGDNSADQQTPGDDKKASSDDKTPETEKNQQQAQQVPLHELLRERNNRQQKERELNELRASVDELKTQLESLRNPQQAQEEELPDPEFDPAGYAKARTAQLEKEIEQLKAGNEQQQQKAIETQQNEAVHAAILQKQTEFEEKTPDFKESISHMRQAQFNMLMEQGFTEQQAIDGIFKHEFDEARQLLNLGLNPAQILYQQSIDQFGYVRPEQTQQSSDSGQLQDDTQRIKEEFATKDAAAAAARGQNKSGGNLSVEQLLKSPDEEFNEIWKSAFGTKNPY